MDLQREHSKKVLLSPPSGILTPTELASISAMPPPPLSLDISEKSTTVNKREAKRKTQKHIKTHESTSSWCVVCRIQLYGNRVMKALGSCTCCMFDIGAHIRIFYTGFWHHGIVSDVMWCASEDRVVSGGSVIHYWKAPSGAMEVIESKLAEFIDKKGVGAIEIVKYCKNQFHSEDTLLLAMRSLGTGKYSFSSNNCEHFATYCKTGIMHSKQADSLKDGAAVGGAALVLTQVAPALFGAMTLGIGVLAAAGYHAIKSSIPDKKSSQHPTLPAFSRVMCLRLIMSDLTSPTAPEILENVRSNNIPNLREELIKRLCLGPEWHVEGLYMTFPEDYNDDFVKIQSKEEVESLPDICSIRLLLKLKKHPPTLPGVSPRRRQMLQPATRDRLSDRLSACALLLPSETTQTPKDPQLEGNMSERQTTSDGAIASFLPCSDDESISSSDDGHPILLQPLSLTSRLRLDYVPSSDSLAGSEWGDKSVVDE